MLEIINHNCFLDKKGNHAFFVKVEEGRHLDDFMLGELTDEIQAYGQLSNFFKMPRFRSLESGGQTMLVTEGVKGECLRDIMTTKPDGVVTAMNALTSDIEETWSKTFVKYDRLQVRRQMDRESINTLQAAIDSPELKPLLRKRLVINNFLYPTLADLIGRCIDGIISNPDSLMVLAHGDEHCGNILTYGDSYRIIDPRLAGYYSPAQVVNNLVGNNYLYFYGEYNQDISISDKEIRINYSVNEEYAESERKLRTPFSNLIKKVESLSTNDFPTREYIFANILRGAIGRVNKKNKEIVDANGLVYIAIASQILDESSKALF